MPYDEVTLSAILEGEECGRWRQLHSAAQAVAALFPDPVLAVRASKREASPGQDVTYTIDVTNRGATGQIQVGAQSDYLTRATLMERLTAGETRSYVFSGPMPGVVHWDTTFTAYYVGRSMRTVQGPSASLRVDAIDAIIFMPGVVYFIGNRQENLLVAGYLAGSIQEPRTGQMVVAYPVVVQAGATPVQIAYRVVGDYRFKTNREVPVTENGAVGSSSASHWKLGQLPFAFLKRLARPRSFSLR